MSAYNCIADDVKLGTNVRLSKFINLYGCEIGDDTKIGAFVEIQKNASIGRRCKISSHSFICEGVTIEDNVFIGHGVTFTNDRYPRATTHEGNLQTEADWKSNDTVIKTGASIGSGATILSNINIGENAIVGAGSVVTERCPSQCDRGWQPGQNFSYVEPNVEGKLPISKSIADRIPFLDLITPHQELEQELTGVFRRALLTAGFIGGPMVEEFEQAFAAFCGASYSIAISSGTDALRFAIMACGVQPGDVV